MRAEVRDGATCREPGARGELPGALAGVDSGVVGEWADAGGVRKRPASPVAADCGVLPGAGPERGDVRVAEASVASRGTGGGGIQRTGAVLASLVASCRRHGVDPFAYLRDVLTRIAATPVSQLDPFLPARWKPAQATAAAE